MIRATGLRLFDPAAESDFGVMTLREIFESWFLPTILADTLERSRPANAATIALYRDALAWWEKTTRNPPAGEIGDADAKAFLAGLASRPYRRSPFGPDRLLSASSRAKHVASVRAILARLTPSDRGECLDVLARRVRMRKPPAPCFPKPTPTIAALKQIMERLRDSAKASYALPAPPGARPLPWWRALLATLYCHGWRLQTALGLERRFLAREEGVLRLRVPGEASVKTHKPAVRPVPVWLAEAWDRAGVQGPAILGRPAAARRLLNCFWRIQVDAGIEGRFSFHSLRRLHAVELGRVGFDIASSLSRDGLQHSSAEITRTHYADLLEAAILRLPCPFE